MGSLEYSGSTWFEEVAVGGTAYPPSPSLVLISGLHPAAAARMGTRGATASVSVYVVVTVLVLGGAGAAALTPGMLEEDGSDQAIVLGPPALVVVVPAVVTPYPYVTTPPYALVLPALLEGAAVEGGLMLIG